MVSLPALILRRVVVVLRWDDVCGRRWKDVSRGWWQVDWGRRLVDWRWWQVVVDGWGRQFDRLMIVLRLRLYLD